MSITPDNAMVALQKNGTLTIETLRDEKNVTVLIIDKRFFTTVENILRRR
jgi:hypothetical protein